MLRQERNEVGAKEAGRIHAQAGVLSLFMMLAATPFVAKVVSLIGVGGALGSLVSLTAVSLAGVVTWRLTGNSLLRQRLVDERDEQGQRIRAAVSESARSSVRQS